VPGLTAPFVAAGRVFAEMSVLPAFSSCPWYGLSGQPCHFLASVARISGGVFCQASRAFSAIPGFASRNRARSSVVVSAQARELASDSIPG